jgi:hypothetical protein
MEAWTAFRRRMDQAGWAQKGLYQQIAEIGTQQGLYQTSAEKAKAQQGAVLTAAERARDKKLWYSDSVDTSVMNLLGF